MNEYKERVVNYRLKYGLTQKEMADKCGLSRPTIIAIERNDDNYPNVTTRHKLEKVLKGE